MNKLHRKFQFSAGDIMCARIAKSGGLFALGSSDKSVYIHDGLGQDAKSRLSNHPTGVESIGFDKSDVILVAGCSGGSVWLWDVEKEAQITSLAGHRSNCSVVEFHPFGSFFASGSSDTNVKIWDQRQSKCVQTYRSHQSEILAIKFSPHGRWLATGDEEGVIKVWDLSAGKELASLESHTGSISNLEFHPTDFFLVSCSSDKSAKLWNCESGFSLAATSESEPLPIRCAKFSASDGRSLTVATNNCLKNFVLDPEQRRITCTHSDESVSFSNLLDLRPLSNGHLTAVSSDGVQVSVWSSDAMQCAPVIHKSSVRDRIASARQKKFEGEKSSPNIQTPSMMMGPEMSRILENRLVLAKSISSLWINGNPRAAIEDASRDVFSFISFLVALPHERTRTALSIDACAKILNHIMEFGLLTLPISSSDSLFDAFASLPFSSPIQLGKSSSCASSSVDLSYIVSTSLICFSYLVKRFGPILSELKRASQMPSTPGTDINREERIAKAYECLDRFKSVMDILLQDAKTTKLLKREKLEAANQVLSLIQP